ncbi:MAG: hypothetical protein KDB02_08090 [Acidimicrobiales bacterium]|nr:hypothetical protein [Acidimicrobiales bacterium]
MTAETPVPPVRPRPGVDVRRRSLGIEQEPDAPTSVDGEGSPDDVFRAQLDAIPDLEPAAVRSNSAPRAAETVAIDTSDVLLEGSEGEGGSRSEVASADDRVVHSDARATRHAGRPAWWRRACFALCTLALVAAIPVLGREGYRLVVRSTAGREVTRSNDPSAPGYEEIVDSTPTMVLVQSNADGSLASLTFLSLNSAKGGTVMFIPNMAPKKHPAYGLGALGMVYDAFLPRVDRAQDAVAHEVGILLNVGIDEVVPLDDRSLAQLLQPVGSIAVDNPNPVTLPDGTVLPVGNVTLTAAQVGPYMGHLGEGEDQLSQFVRQERVWRSWLNAIAASNDPGIVPGSRAQGIGHFLRTLAAGTVNYLPLPGAYDPGGLYVPDQTAMRAAIVDAVPVPDAPIPGARVVVRLLNGVEAGSPPEAIIRKVVAADGAIAVMGNGPSFGRDRTEVVYAVASAEKAARTMLGVLGAKDGTVRLDPSAPDNVDLTVILGRDVLDSEGGN